MAKKKSARVKKKSRRVKTTSAEKKAKERVASASEAMNLVVTAAVEDSAKKQVEGEVAELFAELERLPKLLASTISSGLFDGEGQLLALSEAVRTMKYTFRKARLEIARGEARDKLISNWKRSLDEMFKEQ